MDLKNKLKKKDVLLVKIEGNNYSKAVLQATKELSEKKVCYVTMNKTHSSLEETFSDKGLNMKHFFFIDAISGSIKEVKQNKKRAYFISSPSSLTELSLAISKFLERGFDYMIFDSVNNLLTYHNINTAERFLNRITNESKENGTKTILFALKIKEQEELINKVSTFVDETINLEEGQ